MAKRAKHHQLHTIWKEPSSSTRPTKLRLTKRLLWKHLTEHPLRQRHQKRQRPHTVSVLNKIRSQRVNKFVQLKYYEFQELQKQHITLPLQFITLLLQPITLLPQSITLLPKQKDWKDWKLWKQEKEETIIKKRRPIWRKWTQRVNSVFKLCWLTRLLRYMDDWLFSSMTVIWLLLLCSLPDQFHSAQMDDMLSRSTRWPSAVKTFIFPPHIARWRFSIL